MESILHSLGVEGPKVLTNVIGFLVFFGILYKLAWKRVGDALESRRDSIRRQLEELEQGRREIERLKEEYRTKIGAIEAEAKSRVERIESDAREKARQAISDASDKAHTLLENARKTIELEVEHARRDLVGEIAALARAAAEKVLEREINEDDSRKLVESFLTDLERSKAAV